MKKVLVLIGLGLAFNANAGIINGGFETGNLSGWTATANGSGGCDTDWHVSNNGTTGCTAVSSPSEGGFAAYNSYDGNGPQVFSLSQSFVVDNSLSSAVLNWQEVFTISFCCSASTPGGATGREFRVDLFDSSHSLVNTIFSEDFLWDGSVHSSNGWVSHSVDITADLIGLQGQSVTLSFTNSIRDNFSGPGGFGLDAVSLDIQTASVPEPTSLALLALGFAGVGISRSRKAATK